MAPLASACRKPIGEQMKRLKMGIDNRQQVLPLHQIGTAPPAGSLSHASGVPAPSRRELWGANLSTLDCCYGEVPAVESLSQKSKIFASSLWQGSLAASGRRQCARWLSTIRYLPDLPGIVTEQNGERKYRYCARTDSGGTPPCPVSAACRHFFAIQSSLFTKKSPWAKIPSRGIGCF